MLILYYNSYDLARKPGAGGERFTAHIQSATIGKNRKRMMSIEYEAKILHINTVQFVQRAESLGAKKTGSYQFRRYVFDTIPAQANKWVRLQTDGSRTTITCKEIMNDTVDGTIEKEIVVDDFDQALDVLAALYILTYPSKKKAQAHII